MATRSFIFLQKSEHNFEGIYCHFDGYITHNGRILLENYGALKLGALIARGSIISLGETIEKCKVHNFTASNMICKSIDEISKYLIDSDIDYVYIHTMAGEYIVLIKKFDEDTSTYYVERSNLNKHKM